MKQPKFGGFDMPTQIFDRNDLIVMLRYQFEIGIDEALLDFPDVSAPPATLSELLNLNKY